MRSTGSSPLLFVACLMVTGFTVGCSQSGPGVPSSSTAPSAVTPQASLSQPVATLQSGPGASYDASGSWHFTISLKPNGPPIDEGDDTFTQDANGNLLSADHTVHFTRVGTGSTISYQVSIFEVHRQCNTSLSGQGQLDTKTNTIKAHVLGTEQDCSKAEYFIAATKN